MGVARPKKQTIDYFPHITQHGKTMFIVEQKHGNDGYAFWFKLLEVLGSTDGHYLDLNDDATWEFLQAKTRMDEDFCNGILDLLAKLGAIDPELWVARVIWSQKFVDGLVTVYRNRGVETPTRPSFYTQKPQQCEVSKPENPQSRVDESKVDESRKEDVAGFSATPSPRKIVSLWNEICGDVLPRAERLTDERRNKIRARCNELGRGESWWRDYLARVRASPFCLGENDRGWRADLDWAIKGEQVVTRVLEGRYDAPKSVAVTATGPPVAQPITPEEQAELDRINAELWAQFQAVATEMEVEP